MIVIGKVAVFGHGPFVVYVTVKLPTPDEERLMVPFDAFAKTRPVLPVKEPPESPVTVALG